MKVEDINILIEERTVFYRCLERVKHLEKYRARRLECGSCVWTDVDDPETMEAVRKAMLPIATRLLNESKTRMMLLGVDEFPE